MARELIALMPGAPRLPDLSGLERVAVGDYSAVFADRATWREKVRGTRRGRLKRAVRRQTQLEALMPFGTVLAVEPDTAVRRRDLGALVAANAGLLDRVSVRFKELVQYQITVSWAEERVLAKFRTAPEIAPLFGSVSVPGDAIALAVSRLSERLAAGIRARLGAVAADVAELPCGDTLLSNTVLLVAPDRQAVLDAALEQIDAIWPDGFHIRQIGPAPPVSFATLRMIRKDAAEIKRALETLDLTVSGDIAAIRAARQAALRQGNGDPDTIRSAARLVEAAALAGRPFGPVHLIDIWAEGRAKPSEREKVA